jgi:hypothetical protein
MKYTAKITKKDLENYEEAMNDIADYPLYASTCGVSRATALAIQQILAIDLDNDTEFTLELKTKPKIFDKYPELKI